MFIDKRNEFPAESVAPREHHAELDYHNRRLQDKKNEFLMIELAAGDNHLTGDKLGGWQSVGD